MGWGWPAEAGALSRSLGAEPAVPRGGHSEKTKMQSAPSVLSPEGTVQCTKYSTLRNRII